jgi:hypothetical protein
MLSCAVLVSAGCLAMPHLAHMLFAGFMCIVFGGMTLLMVSSVPAKHVSSPCHVVEYVWHSMYHMQLHARSAQKLLSRLNGRPDPIAV